MKVDTIAYFLHLYPSRMACPKNVSLYSVDSISSLRLRETAMKQHRSLNDESNIKTR